MDGELRDAWSRLAQRLAEHLGELRGRGRTRNLDLIGGLGIEPGEAEQLLAELGARADRPRVSRGLISDGIRTFERAAKCFALSSFERDVLALALAPEVESRFCRVFGYLNDSVVALRPTVGLACAVLAPDAPRSLAAFLPDGRLIRRGLIVTEGDAPLAGRALRIASDFWPHLADLVHALPYAGPRLEDLVFGPATSSRLATALRAVRDGQVACVAIHGRSGRSALARAMAAELAPPVVIDSAAAADVHRAGVRTAVWTGAPIAIIGDATCELVTELTREVRTPIFAAIDAAQLARLAQHVSVFDVPIVELGAAERARLWSRAEVDGTELAARNGLTAGAIGAAITLARSQARVRGEHLTTGDLREAVRVVGGGSDSKLAQRLEADVASDDLVIPKGTRGELDLFSTAVRHGHRLFRNGGHGDRIHTSGGFVALFAGPPGTGKTMAARVIAHDLDVELLRIDLSQVVNKYIGETEKHLDVVFRDAETSGALLFFDEADALFGKRTEVKDARDRYSNLETAFLLQRLEQHAGATILATNLANNLDAAFLRRIHFVIEFPLPTQIERRAIWERQLSPAALAADVDLDFLARFELSGGDIRNAAIAGVLFAATSERVAMRHLVVATARELRKAGRLALPDHFGAWSEDVLAHMRKH